jgi:hypothetical protein
MKNEVHKITRINFAASHSLCPVIRAFIERRQSLQLVADLSKVLDLLVTWKLDGVLKSISPGYRSGFVPNPKSTVSSACAALPAWHDVIRQLRCHVTTVSILERGGPAVAQRRP